jgi:hypothetical protein
VYNQCEALDTAAAASSERNDNSGVDKTKESIEAEGVHNYVLLCAVGFLQNAPRGHEARQLNDATLCGRHQQVVNGYISMHDVCRVQVSHRIQRLSNIPPDNRLV